MSFVETFSMKKNTHFTDKDYYAHRSPQYLANKLNKMIDLNINVYIRNMYADLLYLLRLIIWRIFFFPQVEKSYNRYSWSHGYFNYFLVMKVKKTIVIYNIIFYLWKTLIGQL